MVEFDNSRLQQTIEEKELQLNEREIDFHSVRFLPDGETFLYVALPAKSEYTP